MIDENTAALLASHISDFGSRQVKCQLCDGNRMVVLDPIEAISLKTPLARPAVRTGEAQVYFPVCCQNCGYTFFICATAVIK